VDVGNIQARSDWCLFLYQRKESGMLTLSINRANRGQAVVYAYEKKWLESDTVDDWEGKSGEAGWLPALLESLESK